MRINCRSLAQGSIWYDLHSTNKLVRVKAPLQRRLVHALYRTPKGCYGASAVKLDDGSSRSSTIGGSRPED